MAHNSLDLARFIRAGSDPVEFFKLATDHEPDVWQTSLLRSDAQRVLLLAARQVGKSTVVAAMAVHTAVYEPGSLVLMISPSQRQSGELFRSALEAYNRLGRPVAAEGENLTTLTLENGSRIVSLPGSEITTRGFSAPSMMVIDEAARIDDALWQALLPMARGKARVLMLTTPSGRRGIFFEQWQSDADDWLRIRVAATESKLWSTADLRRQRQLLGDYSFRQEFGLEFVEDGSAVFRFEDIERAFSDPTVKAIRIPGYDDYDSDEVAV